MWPFGSDPVLLRIDAGFSNRGADLDNIFKPLIDTLQALYEEFNDNKVYDIKATKRIVSKGDEYITVDIGRYTGDVRMREATPSEVPGLEENEVHEEKSSTTS